VMQMIVGWLNVSKCMAITNNDGISSYILLIDTIFFRKKINQYNIIL